MCNGRFRIFMLGVGIVIVFLLIFFIGVGNFLRNIQNAKLELIIGALFLFSIALLIRAWRWFILLRRSNQNITFRDVLPSYFITSMISSLTPAKVGEVAAPFIFRRNINTSVGHGFSVVFLNRVFDVSVLVVLVMVSMVYLLFFTSFSTPLFYVFVVSFVVLAVILIMLVAVFVSKNTFLKLVHLFQRTFRWSKTLSDKAIFVLGEIDNFYHELGAAKEKRTMFVLLILTVVGWLIELSAFYLSFSSVATAPFSIVIAIQATAAGLSVASLIPAGIGSGAVIFVYIISSMGYSTEGATAAAVLSKFLFLGAICVYGVLSAYAETMKLRRK